MAIPIKVLVVDDDPTSLLLISHLVDCLALEAVTATDVASAKSAVAEHRPQIAILDVMLPDGDAVDIMAAIEESSIDVAVALLTGSRDQSQLYRCHAWKPDAIFTKPLNPREVGEWLGARQTGIRLGDLTRALA